MKLYLAVEVASTLMEGNYEEAIGVFSTRELAEKAIKGRYWFDKAEKTVYGWCHVFDGELSHFWEVREIELDKEI